MSYYTNNFWQRADPHRQVHTQPLTLSDHVAFNSRPYLYGDESSHRATHNSSSSNSDSNSNNRRSSSFSTTTFLRRKKQSERLSAQEQQKRNAQSGQSVAFLRPSELLDIIDGADECENIWSFDPNSFSTATSQCDRGARDDEQGEGIWSLDPNSFLPESDDEPYEQDSRVDQQHEQRCEPHPIPHRREPPRLLPELPELTGEFQAMSFYPRAESQPQQYMHPDVPIYHQQQPNEIYGLQGYSLQRFVDYMQTKAQYARNARQVGIAFSNMHAAHMQNIEIYSQMQAPPQQPPTEPISSVSNNSNEDSPNTPSARSSSASTQTSDFHPFPPKLRQSCKYCYNRYAQMCVDMNKAVPNFFDDGMWHGHKMRHSGLVTCPHLWAVTCSTCGATKERAHTEDFCRTVLGQSYSSTDVNEEE